MTGSESTDDLERGRQAFERRRWADAFKALSLADEAAPLDACDLGSLAWSAYLIARYDDFMRAMERAHLSYVAAHEPRAAARCAFWLSFVLGSHGDLGPASGWAQRAARLLDSDGSDCVEQGYLIVPELMMHAMGGAWDAVHERAGDAAAVGERFAEPDLIAFARHWQGRALVRMRRAAEGFALLDEAMVSVTTGELSPLITGVIYCSMIEACQEVYDLRRSQEWTRALAAWCDGQPELVPFMGQCRVHRAELMVLHGDWNDAMNEVALASAIAVQAGEQPIAGAALYLRGEIHRLRGEHAEAVEEYEQAHRLGRDPQPGMAMLQLARGEVSAAMAAIRRACDEREDPLDRVGLLPAFVEIMLAAEQLPEARLACDELAETAAAFASSVLRAVAASSRALVDLVENDVPSALRGLKEAERVWQQLDATYQVARIRVAIAQGYAALGDHDGTKLNLDAARAAFEMLVARADLDRVDALESTGRDRAGPLSRRELEVLRLITAGNTNRAIAAALVISEKTVERHVSNILAKLGVSSRAAATAYAYEHRIL
jgi:DNA-binding CsgD family transcriptional regulator